MDRAGLLLVKAGLWLMVLAAPVQASMGAVAFLVLADLVTGVWASIKRGEKFTSWGMRKTSSKLLAYELAILLAYVMECNGLTFLPLVKAVAGFICATEGKSGLENLSKITGLDIWATVRNMIQGNKSNPDKVDNYGVDRQSKDPNCDK